MVPKVRAPQANNQASASRKERRANAYVNRDALQRWLTAPQAGEGARGCAQRATAGAATGSDE